MTDLFEPIAVIGMAVRLPAARDAAQFWSNIRDGRDCVSALTDEQLLAAGVPAERIADPAYVKAAGLLPGIDEFDPEHFRLTPREARMCDPQLRLMLQTTHEAIEDAGHSPASVGRDVAVFAACGPSRYATVNLLPHPEFAAGMDFGMSVLNNIDYLATLVSYKFDFRGPSAAVLTACSSALTAVHLACQALQLGECDAAVAGACNVELPYGAGYRWSPGDVRSVDGHCRPFDAMASGTIFTNGAGVVVLKRLADAVADGDHIRGVVRGIGINNDGSDKVSFSAPSVTGQARAVVDAMTLAGIGADTVSFVEMHATGTALGDPVEVSALAAAYRHLAGDTLAPGSIPVGSVKGNIGHTAAAAGMCGLAKLLLSLEHEQLPPTANLGVLNPRLGLDDTPFQVNEKLRPWPRVAGAPRRAGLSSLGIGGTNVHLVLEEAPPVSPTPAADRCRVVVWSAADEPAERTVRANLAGWFETDGGERFADAVATLQQGRREHPVRAAAVCRDAREAAARLATGEVVTGRAEPDSMPKVAFVFPSDAPYARLAAGLYGTQRVFTETVDVCLEVFAEQGVDLYPGWLDGTEPAGAPLLFAVQYALAHQWMDWGVQPSALVGHGVGELVAATIAGRLDLAEAVHATLSDGEVTAREARIPVYSTVAAAAEHCDVFVELGPMPATGTAGARVVASLPRAGEPVGSDETVLLSGLAALWTKGCRVDWRRVYLDEPLQRTPLPGYPLKRQRHWVDPVVRSAAPPAQTTPPVQAAPVVGPATPFLVPGWVEAAEPGPDTDRIADGARCLALLPADVEAADRTVTALRAMGWQVVRAVVDSRFAAAGDDFTVRPDRLADDLDAVLAELPGAPEVVVHALGMAPENGPDVAAEAERMFRTLLDLVQRAGSRPVGGRLPAVLVLTTGAVDVSGGEPLSPARAVLSAQLRSLAVESPGQRCRLVDCGPGTGVDDLVRELSAGWSDPVVARRRGRRWTPGSRPLRFDQPTAEPVRPAGAYVITGGLGGLGSVLARAIAGTGGRPKLALLSRRADSADGLRAELEAQGAEVRVIACDLADRARTDEALDSVLDRFGGITAVFHLAGVPGRQLMPVLDAADAAAVLRPKVAGTAALAHWLDRRAPGTPVVCFSSRAALTGMIGGADYAAANAFLDAFAAVRPGWLSINWPVWTEVGMAAGTRLDAARRPAADPAGDLVEETTLAASTCWAMDEHRVRGVAVLPGTAVVDLVIGAFLRTVPGAVAPVVLRDVVFQHPISGNQPRRVRVVFDRSDGPEWRVRVVSRPAEGDGEWRQHAVCAVAHADVTGRTVDVEPLRRTGTEKPVRRARPGGVLAFGPRWHNVGRAWESAEATLVEVELHPPYAAETTDHAVHPALLDTATGFLGGPTDDGFFAPFAYRTLTWLRPLPARLHSVLRPRQRSADSVVVDVDLVDPQGEVVVAVEGLTMRRTDARSFAADGGPDTKAPSPRPGLTPRDGIRLLFELLGHRVRGQVAVAPPDAGEPTESPAPPAPAPAGPEVPPDMPVGDRLRALWCEVLGRTDVTADSDFVDLGGDSLVAVALTGRIRDSFGVELGIGAVFEFPTLAELTDALVAQLDEQERT